MKIYVSGSFNSQARLRHEAAKLWEEGHQIVSSWLHETKKPEHLSYDQWMLHLARKDVAEAYSADCIIVDLIDPSTSGGRYTEMGIAIHPSSTTLLYTVGGKVAKGSTRPYGCFLHMSHGHINTWPEMHAFLKGHPQK